MEIDATLRERWKAVDGAHELELPAGWMQGRSVFGGLTGAACVALGARHVSPERVLRTVSTQLIAPVAAGPVRGRAVVVREGKGVSFVDVRLSQDERDVASASMVFVTPRHGSLVVPAAAAPDGPGPETLVDLPYIPGFVPEFTQNVQMRWASGSVPFSGGTSPRFHGYCRFRDHAGDAEGIVAMLDVWPSPTLGMLTKPAFASTVSWTAHVHHVPRSFDGWFTFEYETVAGADGFHTVAGRLFAPDGAFAGWTEQLVALFD
ncbi:MAG: thioesterase family protein [Myxococcales bacterium]|nr:thioesterase family protein [Myxococcales bacterium]